MIGRLVSNLLGLVGAALGAVAGFYLFRWLVSQNLYGLMIPGAALGLGCSLLAQHRSPARGLICACAAAILALYIEWRFFPFNANGEFKYLVTHFFDLKPMTQLMTALGSVFAYWFGKDPSPLLTIPGVIRPESAPKPE